MNFVFIGPTPRFPSPDDYYVNRARRGKLPAFLTLQETGALCVSSDTGEDRDRAREATALLYSLKAGGLLVTVLHDGRQCVTPAALRAVAEQLEAASFFGEGAGIWAKVPMAVARDEADYQVDRESAIGELEKMGYGNASVILTHPGRSPWLLGTAGASPGSRWWLALVAAFKANETKSINTQQHVKAPAKSGVMYKVRG